MGEIRFAGIGETSGYPYLVCKKKIYIVLARIVHVRARNVLGAQHIIERLKVFPGSLPTANTVERK